MRRWLKRIGLTILAVVVLGITAALVFIHTPPGRELERREIEAQLNNLFTGGGTVGKVEGTPFGELIIKDVVIRGPDRKPAISVGELRVRVHLIDLVHKDVSVGEVLASDIDVELGKDTLAGLMKPSPEPDKPEQKSTWNVDLGGVALRRAHVMYDTNTPQYGVVDLDNLSITANAQLHSNGMRGGGVTLTAVWRQKAVPISIAAIVKDDADHTIAPAVTVAIDGVSLAGQDLELVKQGTKFAGGLKIVAPKAEVARLTGIELPDDVALLVGATKDGHVALDGRLGATPIRAALIADIDAKHVAGKLATGDFDLAKLTNGGVQAVAGATIDLDVAQGKPGELPTAHATLHAHATYQKLPRTELVIGVDSKGQSASTTIDLHGAAVAKIAAAVTRDGQSYKLDRASIDASAKNVAPQVTGAVDVKLVAHGPLWPRPSLTVVGSVRGKALAAFGASASDVEVSLDTRGVPNDPKGTVHVHAFDLARGESRYGTLALDATSRPDGWLDVGLASKSPQWIVELAARVKPPGDTGTTQIAIAHHRVRTKGGADFSGSSGTIVVGPEQITVRDLKSSSRQGDIAVDATYAKTGDIRATLDVHNVSLSTVKNGYVGSLGAHVGVERTSGKLSAQVDIDGSGLAFQPKPGGLPLTPLGLHVKLDAKPGRVTLDGNMQSPTVGKATVALAVNAPQDLTDVAAWQKRGRDALELAKIEMDNVDLAKLASTFGGADAKLSGKLGGKLELTSTGADGTLQLRDLRSPALEGTGGIDADIAITQPSADELAPKLAVQAKQLGRVDAQLDLKLPAKPFDAAAWQKLGARALKSASLQTKNLAFDPGLLKRFGVSSLLRGHATVDVEVGEALSSVKATVTVPDLRGSPLAKPVNTEIEADIDGKQATATVSLKTDKQVAMLNAKAMIPISIAQLRGDPKILTTLPLTASVDIPQTSAPQLLAVFGRTEIVAGNMSGKIEVAGTVGTPTGKVHLEADGLQVPPGPGGKPIKEVKQLAIDAAWDGAKATLKIQGTEDKGGTLSLDAAVAPKQLAQGTAKITAKEFDLVPVLAFAPGPAGGAAGQLDGTVNVTSFDPRTMKISGDLKIKDARIPIAPEVGTLRDAAVEIGIGQQGLKVTANGKLGRGTLDANAQIALVNFAPTGGQAKILLKHVSPIGAVQPLVDAQIDAKLAKKGEGWQADIDISHGFIKLDTTSGEKLKPVGGPSDLAFGAKPPPPKPKPGQTAKPQSSMFVANVKIEPIPVESDQVRTTVRGDLHAVADLQGIDVKGKIETQGGDVELFDRRYRIEQAEVQFDGSLDPLIAVEISYDFPDVTLDAKVNGRASKPQLQLSSNPGNYTQSQLLGFLLGGEPGGDTQSSSVADTATSAGESFIGAQLGNYVKKAIPGIKVDVLKYNAASATSSEAIEAGTWITHTLFFQLTEHPEARPDENDEEGTLEYWITHRLELQVTAGDRNYDGVDMLWRRRY
jgi:TamB, inner membrane protein subunit of TAM complex